MRETGSAVCPVCGGTQLEPLIELPQMPVFCNLLWPDRAAALAVPRGDIRLVFCQTCGHIFNQAFDPGLMDYSQAYENSLHFSPRFQTYARSLAGSLVERYDLRGKDIIEIGCGQGDFLKLLCELGGNRGLGFDPSYVDDGEAPSGITFIRDYYSETYARRRADFVCSRHVLEHLQQPRDFVASLRRALGDRPDVVVFVEVPDAGFMLGHVGVWDIIYEHYSYFGRASLSWLFEDVGFHVLDIYTTFGDQFLCLEGSPGAEVGGRRTEDRGQRTEDGGQRTEDGGQKSAIRNSQSPIPNPQSLTPRLRAFADASAELLAGWRRELGRMAGAGRRGVVWGAGSKGVTFLNLLSPGGDPIEYVVDINPRKLGMFVAGAGQKIVAPGFLQAYRPDVVIIMNRNYEAEIREMVAGMGLAPEFRVV